MIFFDNTLISLEIFKQQFICHLPKCHGSCCSEGDYGAPLTTEELEIIEANLGAIKTCMTGEGIEMLQEKGFHEPDPFGEPVTKCIRNKDCIFAFKEGGIFKCAIERAYEKGLCEFKKPISCHLYPIRLGNLKDMVSVNYSEWSICKPALVHGKRNAMPLYVFLKEPLIRRFGENWYKELDQIAKELESDGHLQ
jgi:hypothetical protein